MRVWILDADALCVWLLYKFWVHVIDGLQCLRRISQLPLWIKYSAELHMQTSCKSKSPDPAFLKKMSLSSLRLLHFWVFTCEVQSWLCDSNMCSTCCMYKQTGARSEILALTFYRCDPGKSAHSVIWPTEPLGSGDFTHQPWFSHLALVGYPLWCRGWANLTQRALFSEYQLGFCNHLKTGIGSNELHTPSSSKWKHS